MPKRYEALRGVGGGLRQRYVTSFFLATVCFTVGVFIDRLRKTFAGTKSALVIG